VKAIQKPLPESQAGAAIENKTQQDQVKNVSQLLISFCSKVRHEARPRLYGKV